MNDADIRAAKADLRRTMLARRREAAAAAPDAGARLKANLLAAVPVPPGAAVAGFWPMGDEIDVRPLLFHFHARGHVCGLPVTGRRGERLRFRRWTPETELVAAVFGTREPPPEAPPVEPDLLLVPLLAFDAAGWRLGYGAGFYDRTLTALRARKSVLAVGVAYAAQEAPAVPHDAGDARLDWVVTEAGALRVAAG
jgi:5-formyltetrahydrofolate cyclo-ligase